MKNNDSKKTKSYDGEVLDDKANDAVIIDQNGLDLKKSGNIIIGTLNVFKGPIKDRHEKHYKESSFHLIADIILVFIIIALLFGNYLISILSPEQKIVLSVTSRGTQVTSLADNHFKISYENNSKEAIDNAVLVLRPSKNINFAIQDSNKDFSENKFKLGRIEAGGRGEISLVAMVVGNINEEASISAFLNFNKDEKSDQVVAIETFDISTSLISLEAEGPKEQYPQNIFDLNLVLSNNTDISFEDVIIDYDSDNLSLINLPDPKANISLTEEQQNIGALNARGENVLKTRLRAEEALASEASFTASVKYADDYYVQAKTDYQVNINESKLITSINTESVYLDPEEEIYYNINYQNKESETLQNVTTLITSADDDFIVDYQKVVSGDAQINGDYLVLSDMGANQEKNIQLLFNVRRLKPAIEKDFRLRLDHGFLKSGIRINKRSYSEPIPVVSDLKFLSSSRYYSPEGDQLGVGPLPPEVGKPTSYWVYWEVENYGNRVENFLVTAKLADGVQYFDKKSLLSGIFAYDEDLGTIAWNVRDLPKSGSTNKLRFELSLIPDSSMRGRIPELLSDIEYSAIDAYTGAEIGRKIGDLDTDLSNDSYVKEPVSVVR